MVTIACACIKTGAHAQNRYTHPKTSPHTRKQVCMPKKAFAQTKLGVHAQNRLRTHKNRRVQLKHVCTNETGAHAAPNGCACMKMGADARKKGANAEQRRADKQTRVYALKKGSGHAESGAHAKTQCAHPKRVRTGLKWVCMPENGCACTKMGVRTWKQVRTAKNGVHARKPVRMAKNARDSESGAHARTQTRFVHV